MTSLSFGNSATRLHLREHNPGQSVRDILDSKVRSGNASHDIFYHVDTNQDKQLTCTLERPLFDLSKGQMCDMHIRSQSLNNCHCFQPDPAWGLGLLWETTAQRSQKCYLSTNPSNSDQGVQRADADMYKIHALSAIQRLCQGCYSNTLPLLTQQYLPREQYCGKCLTSISSFLLYNTAR